MTITSTAFLNNAAIPDKYSYHGGNVSPPLDFEDIPSEAQSLALICHDPDAPSKNGFCHWLMWNINPLINHVEENSPPKNAVLGTTDWGENDWGGPAPPSGTHRYIFTLYALSREMYLPVSTTEKAFLEEIQPYVLEAASIIGLFSGS